MKALLALLIAACFSLTANAELKLYDDQDLYCEVTSDNKRYEDQFIIEVRKEGLSKIKYRRKHLAAPEGRYGDIEIVRGCYHAKQVGSKHHPQMISVECREDGQEGMASVDSNTLAGWLYFYYPKVGYGERTELQIQCKRY